MIVLVTLKAPESYWARGPGGSEMSFVCICINKKLRRFKKSKIKVDIYFTTFNTLYCAAHGLGV